MSLRRQLAAIMFTDIEGYSAAMQQDEQRAIDLRDRHREVLENKHKHYDGRIIQYYGDGTLSIFQSAVEAVRCAVAMQQEFSNGLKVPVRMALHIGDIAFDNEQVFGDGVNLASRIESLAIGGSVLISDKVNDEINNHPELKTVSMGAYQFKNINRSVEVFALDHDGLIMPIPNSLKGKTKEKKETLSQAIQKSQAKSIAVMPFVNISNDPEQEYFSVGVAEEILNSLSSIKDLKVAGRTSSFQFNRKDVGLREIGEKLGVSSVLEGSVRKQGNRLRIMVQLVNVDDGFHLWSEKYDRDMDDIFAIQDEVALAVTEKLKVTLLEKDRTRLNRSYNYNTEAYELYLKGRFYLSRRGAYIMTAIHYFQLAIDLDPRFALAYTGFADASLMAAFYGLVLPRQIAPKAKQAAETAVELDPFLCEPYCSLGFYYTVFEWNWEKAEKNFLAAIELNPSYAQAHYWYGLNLLSWVKSDFDNGEKQGRIALDLEPYSAICFGIYGAIQHASGNFKEAIATCKKGIELDVNTFICHLFTGWAYLALRQYEDTVSIFTQLMKASNRHHFSVNGLILTYCMMGKVDEARVLLDELKERSASEYIGWTVTALSMAFLGEPDKAFEYLEKAYNDREPVLLTMRQLPVPDTLKNDPRFQMLMERIGFP